MATVLMLHASHVENTVNKSVCKLVLEITLPVEVDRTAVEFLEIG